MTRHYFLILTTYYAISTNQLSDNGKRYNLKVPASKIKAMVF
jgi:hypothetical protein